MGRIGDTLTNVVIDGSKTSANYDKVTKNFFGADISDADVDNVVYVKVGTEYFKKTGAMYDVSMWGAKPNGEDCTAAFQAAADFCSKVGALLTACEGSFRLNATFRLLCSFIGASMEGTILNYGDCTDPIGLHFGLDDTNHVRRRVGNFNIVGNETVTGFAMNGTGTVTNAFHDIKNIFMFDVRDGVYISETASVYKNTFRNINIQKYSHRGIHAGGNMNKFTDCFISSPNGEGSILTPNTTKGANNLAIYDIGGNNKYEHIEMEDQFVFNGNATKAKNLTVEYLLKGQPSSDSPNGAFRIGGGGIEIDGLRLIGMNKNVISYLGECYGTDFTLKSFKYQKPTADVIWDVPYPFIGAGGSSGSIDGYDANSAVTQLPIDHPSLIGGLANWDLKSVKGTDNVVFNRPLNLRGTAAVEPSLPLTGGTVTGFTSFTGGAQLNGGYLKSLVYVYTSFLLRNKADTTFIDFININDSGSERAMDLNNIGKVKRGILPADFADDAAAAAGGIAIGEEYRTGNVLKIRLA